MAYLYSTDRSSPAGIPARVRCWETKQLVGGKRSEGKDLGDPQETGPGGGKAAACVLLQLFCCRAGGETGALDLGKQQKERCITTSKPSSQFCWESKTALKNKNKNSVSIVAREHAHLLFKVSGPLHHLYGWGVRAFHHLSLQLPCISPSYLTLWGSL